MGSLHGGNLLRRRKVGSLHGGNLLRRGKVESPHGPAADSPRPRQGGHPPARGCSGGDRNMANRPQHGLRWLTAWWDPEPAATSLQSRFPCSTKLNSSRWTSLLPLAPVRFLH